MNKNTLIIVGIVVAVVVMFGSLWVSVGNGVINVEEQVNSADASTKVEEKRRVDLVQNLVDCVQDYAQYEQETLTKLAELRTSAGSGGNIEEAQMVFKAVAEAYPELKANEQYKSLMLELSSTENRIATMRENYNREVRGYNKYVRKFPNAQILGVQGYEPQNYKYLDFQAPVDAPQNLFKNNN